MQIEFDINSIVNETFEAIDVLLFHYLKLDDFFGWFLQILIRIEFNIIIWKQLFLELTVFSVDVETWKPQNQILWSNSQKIQYHHIYCECTRCLDPWSALLKRVAKWTCAMPYFKYHSNRLVHDKRSFYVNTIILQLFV